MKKVLSVILISVLCISLISCGNQAEEPAASAAESSETPSATVEISAGLVSSLESLCVRYSVLPKRLNKAGCANINAVIPEEKLSEAAEHAEKCSISLSGDFYEFEYNSDENHTYDVWGQDVLDETQTLPPSTDDEDGDGAMESVSGDLMIEGGGRFTRRYIYRIASDGSSGSSEMQCYLNGEFIGHERFDWVISDDGVLRFSDAALSQEQFDGSDEGFTYILVLGIMSQDELELIETEAVTESADIPRNQYIAPSSLSNQTLSSIKNWRVSLSVRNNTATEMRDGRTYTYQLSD